MTETAFRLQRWGSGPFLVRQCVECGFVEAFPEQLVDAWGGVLELPRWDCPNVELHDVVEPERD
jgi:hypothetical protein